MLLLRHSWPLSSEGELQSHKVKSYKREVALLLFIGLGWVVFTGDIEMVKVLVWPVFTFALGAFGLDSYAKQIKDTAGSYSTNGDSRL